MQRTSLKLARIALAGWLAVFGLFAAGLAFAQVEETTVRVVPGEKKIFHTAPCVTLVSPANSEQVRIVSDPNGQSHAIFQAPEQFEEQRVILRAGTDQGDACESQPEHTYLIKPLQSAEIPLNANLNAVSILVAAFVVALLLENAFALLFNWRLFHEFFAGKAWKTPIMFVGAWLAVLAFDFDLVYRLFVTYGAKPEVVLGSQSSTLFTQILTAMILAGGSVGVNRIMVALGFRTRIRLDLAAPTAERKEAWISIAASRANDKVGDGRIVISVDELDDTASINGASLPIAGVFRERSLKDRVMRILFPAQTRIPPSGGRRVSRPRRMPTAMSRWALLMC